MSAHPQALPTCKVTEVCWRQRAKTRPYGRMGQQPRVRSFFALPTTEAHPQRPKVSSARARSRCSVLHGEVGVCFACWLPLARRRLQGPKEPAKGPACARGGSPRLFLLLLFLLFCLSFFRFLFFYYYKKLFFRKKFIASEFNKTCFLRGRCSMEMWCPDDTGRDSWVWVGPPAVFGSGHQPGRACVIQLPGVGWRLLAAQAHRRERTRTVPRLDYCCFCFCCRGGGCGGCGCDCCGGGCGEVSDSAKDEERKLCGSVQNALTHVEKGPASGWCSCRKCCAASSCSCSEGRLAEDAVLQLVVHEPVHLLPRLVGYRARALKCSRAVCGVWLLR